MRSRHRTHTLVPLVVLALALLPPLASAEWPMDGGNSHHTGEQTTPLIGPANQWEVEVNGELVCPPATAYGKLYIGTSDGYLKVLDEVTGDVLWELRLGESICATPLIDAQTAFVPTGPLLQAITLTDKSTKWTFEAVGDLRASAIMSGNYVYIGSEDKHIYALDKYTGDREWSVKLDDVVSTSPSVTGLTLVIGTEAGTVYGIHPHQGEVLWQTYVGSAISTAPCISQDTAMVGTFEGRLHAVDIDDGELLWTYPSEEEPALDPILTTPVTNSGLVYIGTDGLYCLEVRTGNKVWHHATEDTVRGAAAIVESYLVFGCYDGEVRCLDKNTGRVIWRFRSGTVFRSGVSIDYDKAFIGGRDGQLYARSILNRMVPVVTGPFVMDAEAHDSIQFEVEASDPEGNLLTFHWDFGDGNTSSERRPLHEYPLAGEYFVEVTVSDGTKSKKHTITLTVHPFETKVEGGDGGGVSMALAVGAALVIAVVLVVVLLALRIRRGKMRKEAGATGEALHAGEAPPTEVVEWEETPEAGPDPYADPGLYGPQESWRER